jgi:hypothetical protein
MEQPLDGDPSLLAVQAMSAHLTVRFRTVSRRGPCGAFAMTGISLSRFNARAKRTSILHGGHSAPLSIQAWTSWPAVF